MFYYTNGKVTVLAHRRCGNTNMYHYFDIPPYSLSYTELPVDNLVVVVRNPIDRMVSAIKGLSVLFEVSYPIQDHATRKTVIFEGHCKPYLYQDVVSKGKDFRIIDFYKLEQYIPRKITAKYSPIKIQSPVTNTSGLTDPKEHYVKNSSFSLIDLEQEYDLYRNIMRVKEQISVEEWKSLTP